ncbi:class II D-tagatose-bisphosphate aldolase, non-catalytic subunit [candidate division KSB1 bacterium]|nr:class II D-tagatose-bisphosphate aldolase, non-catalytic subunit [candidate division KSB1 bacterium]
MTDTLKNIVKAHKQGDAVGIYSVCSANQYVLEASMNQAKQDDSVLLIESTSNQVDQFGGYMNMTPDQFVSYVHSICQRMDFPAEQVILGGDHLGPNVWQGKPSDEAMKLARDLIKAYVLAGYTKIHLDTSIRCADDPGDKNTPLATETIAERAAQLCEVAEQTSASFKNKPLYIVGTEVPTPGGAREELTELIPTKIDDLQDSIELTKQAFYDRHLQDAWERVIAVVVQPGVEFGDLSVVDYDRSKAWELIHFIERYHFVYEAHSTDYQLPPKLKELVEDHFAILKVGPGLTFALREAIFALAQMERELMQLHRGLSASNIIDVIDDVMLNKSEYWKKHYHGNEQELAYARKYSYSDRIRYYWPAAEIQAALHVLIQNLDKLAIPFTLLGQYMPNQYWAIRNGKIKASPVHLIHHKIQEIVSIYASATNQSSGV